MDSPKYSPPPVTVGPCLWFQAPGAEPIAGMITAVNQRTVDVMTFPPGSRTVVLREAARHVTDPEFPKMRHTEAGVWDFTEEHKALVELGALIPL